VFFIFASKSRFLDFKNKGFLSLKVKSNSLLGVVLKELETVKFFDI
jgi:hypothetical protein